MTAISPLAFQSAVECPADALDASFETELLAGAHRIDDHPLKRAIDLLGGIIGLVVLSPLLLLVGLLLWVEIGAWPIFRQERTGLGGRTFVIFKFRTMRVCEERGAVVQAIRHDTRVTPIGGFLRRTSIDELPQLWNVLRGEMSLVGPRPHAVAHDVHYGALLENYHARFLTKPGITGLAQVAGFRGRTPQPGDMAARVEKDLEYIRRWSVGLDLMILMRTPLVLAFHPMAY
ncbi:MAG TPA: sugar transferase [Caulobacteraceae bacterium]|jgi:lipopolysaccharide/colanic/teichoic acid biosynthesis glycosyltransferase